MNRLSHIIRQGVYFRQKEFFFSLFVFIYLLFSLYIFSLKLSEGHRFAVQVLFILLENYVTIAVYYGIKQYLFEGIFNLPNMFAKARCFFLRVLAYKMLAGFFALLLFAFCLSMLDLVKDSSIFAAGFITSFTILWISVPVYLLLLTFLTPLIIIVEDTFLFASLRKSITFIRENLSGTVKLVLAVTPLWVFAFFLMRMYNDIDLFLLTVIFSYIIAVLEIITVKIFLLFYKARGKDNG
jgi:hypothetical protein